MRTNCAMTLYNKVIVAGAETYRRTPIVAVTWENRKQANVLRSGLIAADSVTVYVPLSVCANYVKPKAFLALAVKTGKFTFAVGDYIVKGLVADEITTAFTITMLKAAHDDCVRISSVDTMDEGSARMRHFQLGAA